MPHDERLYPHSPDVLERATSDNGFSDGWGLHITEDCGGELHPRHAQPACGKDPRRA